MSTPTVLRTFNKLDKVAGFILALQHEDRDGSYRFFFPVNGNAPKQVEIRWTDPQKGLKVIVFKRDPDNSFRYTLIEGGREVTQFTAREEMEETEIFPFGAEFYRLLGEKISSPFTSIATFFYVALSLAQKGLKVEVAY